jgi:4-carboxymuconolactone decarboxylase
MTARRASSSPIHRDALEPDGGWISPASARLIAPSTRDRGLMFRGVSLLAKSFGRSQVPDIFSVLHINARLFWAWLFFASRLMPGGRLPAKDREKIILRTAWLCRSRYEWGQHVALALSVGVSDAEIVELTRDTQDSALLRACDELVRDRCISDPTWQALASLFDDKLMIEIVLLIGHYQMIAGFLNSAGLQLEASIEEQLQAFYQRVGGAPVLRT